MLYPPPDLQGGTGYMRNLFALQTIWRTYGTLINSTDLFSTHILSLWDNV